VRDEEERQRLGNLLIEKLPMFTVSTHLEVQERACTMLEIMKIAQEHSFSNAIIKEMASLFEGELNPVAPKAQKKVPVPPELDLETWINDPLSEEETEKEDYTYSSNSYSNKYSASSGDFYDDEQKYHSEEDETEKETKRAERKKKRQHDPFYLGDYDKKKPASIDVDDIDSIPIATLTPDELGLTSSKDKKKEREREKERRSRRKEIDRNEINLASGEMPEGASKSDDEAEKAKKKSSGKNIFDPMDVDLTTPLGKDEELPALKAYDSPMDIRKRDEKLKLERERMKEAAAQKEEERKKRDKRREEKKDKERDRDRHRDKDRDRDRDRKDREKEKDKGGDKKKARSSHSDKKEEPSNNGFTPAVSQLAPAGRTNEDLLDLLGDTDLLPAPKKSPTPAPAPVAASPVPEKEKEKDKEKERDRDRDREKDKSKSSSSSSKHDKDRDRSDKDRDRDRERERDRDRKDKDRSSRDKDRDKEREKEKDRDKEKETTGDLLSDDLLGLDLGHQNVDFASFATIGENQDVKIGYKVEASPNRPNEVTGLILIQNKSREAMSQIEFTVLDTLNLKLNSAKNGVVTMPFTINPGKAEKSTLKFIVQDVTANQVIKANVGYNLMTSTSNKIDVKMPFNSSAFMVPTACTKSQFAGLLSDVDLFSFKESKIISTGTRKHDNVVSTIATNLHLTVVEKLSIAASLYGKSIQDHHVAMLVKVTEQASANGGSYTVDIKSSNQRLATNLANEIVALFA